MTLPFSEQEIAALAALVLNKRVLDERDFSVVGKRQPADYFSVVNQYRPFLVAPNLNSSLLTQKINDDLILSGKKMNTTQNPQNVRLSTPIPPSLSLPPKMRAKAIAASSGTPTKTVTSNQVYRQDFDSKLNSQLKSRFPLLSKPTSLPKDILDRSKSSERPEIGSLAVIIHPSIGPVQVCRVLALKIIDDSNYYLVSFFVKQNSPCYVPEESLMKVDYQKGFPLSDEVIESIEVSVDWILERIISTAQDLVISNGELLTPIDSNIQGSMSQQSVLSNVVCASFMILCYTSGRWKIPEPKLKLIFETISRTCPPKYESSRIIVAAIEQKLSHLLSLKNE